MKNQTLDPYIILGVPPNALDSEIKMAYEKLSQRLAASHKAGHLGAKIQFQQVLDAYNLLSDRNRRKEYDKQAEGQRVRRAFQVRVTPSKRVVESIKEPQVIYLYVEILPQLSASNPILQRESGLNLTLVLDHSNSMNGIRLDRVKVAATEIINHLTENDFISVVSFNDRSEVVIPASRVVDKSKLASRTRMSKASGGTEIYQGLKAGVEENRKNFSNDRINHIILLTDGDTYGDREQCLALAHKVAEEGMTISALGLGSEWNDDFLDEIATLTGGASGFIKSASSVVAFMNGQVQSVANAFAERLQLSIAPEPNVEIEMAFKIKPSPQPLSINELQIPIGGLQSDRSIGVLLQLQLPPNLPLGFQPISRLVVTGSIMSENRRHAVASDFALEISHDIDYEDPPDEIMDSLGKLTLYRMQERVQESVKNGDIEAATRQLNTLATRLFEMGQDDLAQEAQSEAVYLQKTNMLSDEGRKNLKYQTRHLINPDADNEVSL